MNLKELAIAIDCYSIEELKQVLEVLESHDWEWCTKQKATQHEMYTSSSLRYSPLRINLSGGIFGNTTSFSNMKAVTAKNFLKVFGMQQKILNISGHKITVTPQAIQFGCTTVSFKDFDKLVTIVNSMRSQSKGSIC